MQIQIAGLKRETGNKTDEMPKKSCQRSEAAYCFYMEKHLWILERKVIRKKGETVLEPSRFNH